MQEGFGLAGFGVETNKTVGGRDPYSSFAVLVDTSHEPLKQTLMERETANLVCSRVILMKRLITTDPHFAGAIVKQGIPGHSRHQGQRRTTLFKSAGASNAI